MTDALLDNVSALVGQMQDLARQAQNGIKGLVGSGSLSASRIGSEKPVHHHRESAWMISDIAGLPAPSPAY